MKPRFSLMLAWLPLAAQDPGADPRFQELARRVVQVSAAVKPGDVVLIEGGKHTIPLMEELAIEALKAGGQVEMLLSTDRVMRSFLLEVPEKYLERELAYWTEWMKQVNVVISLPGAQADAYKGVPEARWAKLFHSGRAAFRTVDSLPVRRVFVNYPTRQNAALLKLDFAVLEKMHWEAVNADYQAIAAKGMWLKQKLEAARLVRLTSPDGTDLTFSPGNRHIFVNDGIASLEKGAATHSFARRATLPGGSVQMAPIETSANGKVVVPTSWCDFDLSTGISFEFNNGKLKNFKAEKGGDCYQRMLAAYGGALGMFGSFSIGLNPALKVLKDPFFVPTYAAGSVYIGIGDNEMLGGDNKGPTRWVSFPIAGATVELDGQTIIRDGQIVF